MEHVLAALASLLMYMNPVEIAYQLSLDQFITFAQIGILIILTGFCILALTRSGMPYQAAVIGSIALALMGVVYLFWRDGNPFGVAERGCALFGSLFRFVGGVGVATGVVFLVGLQNVRGRHPICLFHPVAIVFALLYGFLCLTSLHANAGLQHNQVWVALSIAAAWVSFGGILGAVWYGLGTSLKSRPLAIIAAGCIAIVLLTMLHQPFSDEYRLLYAGSFPAGIFIGAVTVPAWI